MSGPVTAADATIEAEPTAVQPAVLEITESGLSQVGAFQVRRALPRRERRTVGPWCFVDHMGPATVDERGLGVAPHPTSACRPSRGYWQARRCTATPSAASKSSRRGSSIS